MIGWNENLHTLGPPWQRLDIPALKGERNTPSLLSYLIFIDLYAVRSLTASGVWRETGGQIDH